jgi:hypothetical protein
MPRRPPDKGAKVPHAQKAKHIYLEPGKLIDELSRPVNRPFDSGSTDGEAARPDNGGLGVDNVIDWPAHFLALTPAADAVTRNRRGGPTGKNDATGSCRASAIA